MLGLSARGTVGIALLPLFQSPACSITTLVVDMDLPYHSQGPPRAWKPAPRRLPPSRISGSRYHPGHLAIVSPEQTPVGIRSSSGGLGVIVARVDGEAKECEGGPMGECKGLGGGGRWDGLSKRREA